MKRKEIIFFAALLVVAAAAIVVMQLINQGASGKIVLVTVDGEEYRRIPFNDSTDMSFTIRTDAGSNDVVIEGGHVDVVSADCPSQVCVDTKQASEIGDMIVCLPHKVVIEIIKDDAD